MSKAENLREQLKADFVSKRGYWNPFWDGLLSLDPMFFEAYLEFSSVPWEHGTLAPKVKELIYIAIDASTTHLYEPGLRQHIQNALKYGATQAEIMEVYELTSVLGIHTCTFGVPVLMDELAAANMAVPDSPLDEQQSQLKADFMAKRGYWNPFWDGLLRMAPHFFEAYLKFSSVPWQYGTLEPKIKELIYIAIDASTTHLYEPGLRQHVQNAIKYGATSQEIMEVLQLTSVLGIHTCTMGVPILLDELGKAGK